MKSLACLVALLSTGLAPGQTGGVAPYGTACGDILCSANPARAGKDLSVYINVQTAPRAYQHALLGIGFNRAELYVSGPMNRICTLYIDPYMVVSTPLIYRVKLRSLTGGLTVMKEIPPTMIGLKLYFQAVYTDQFTPYWSNGLEVTVTK